MGAGDAFIAGGVESMTMVPQGGFNFSPNPRFAFDGQPGTDQFYDAYISMGQTAENVAARHGIAREDQERLAVDSHAKAARAQADGLLAGEIVPVVVADGSRVEEDGCIRSEEHTSEIQSLMRISYAVFCLKKKKNTTTHA